MSISYSDFLEYKRFKEQCQTTTKSPDGSLRPVDRRVHFANEDLMGEEVQGPIVRTGQVVRDDLGGPIIQGAQTEVVPPIYRDAHQEEEEEEGDAAEVAAALVGGAGVITVLSVNQLLGQLLSQYNLPGREASNLLAMFLATSIIFLALLWLKGRWSTRRRLLLV